MWKNKKVVPLLAVPTVAAAFAGSWIGANLNLIVSETVLSYALIVILPLVAVIVFSKKAFADNGDTPPAFRFCPDSSCGFAGNTVRGRNAAPANGPVPSASAENTAEQKSHIGEKLEIIQIKRSITSFLKAEAGRQAPGKAFRKNFRLLASRH